MRGRHAATRLAAPMSLALAAVAGAALAQPAEILIRDKAVVPENIASLKDGTVFMGSVGTANIYRAAPGAGEATVWSAPAVHGMARVMGVFADEARGELLACDAGGREAEGKPASPSVIKALDLSTGQVKSSHPLGEGRSCNDLTRTEDGTIYASDMGGHILRLKAGERAFSPWISDPQIASADGLAVMGGQLYVNTFRSGLLYRIAIQPNGDPGAPVRIATSLPLTQPDGMRLVGDKLLLAEGSGRVSELSFSGDTATVRVLKEGLPDSPTSLTLVGQTLYVSLGGWTALRDPAKDTGVFRAVAVPYAAAP